MLPQKSFGDFVEGKSFECYSTETDLEEIGDGTIIEIDLRIFIFQYIFGTFHFKRKNFLERLFNL